MSEFIQVIGTFILIVQTDDPDRAIQVAVDALDDTNSHADVVQMNYSVPTFFTAPYIPTAEELADYQAGAEFAARWEAADPVDLQTSRRIEAALEKARKQK